MQNYHSGKFALRMTDNIHIALSSKIISLYFLIQLILIKLPSHFGGCKYVPFSACCHILQVLIVYFFMTNHCLGSTQLVHLKHTPTHVILQTIYFQIHNLLILSMAEGSTNTCHFMPDDKLCPL